MMKVAVMDLEILNHNVLRSSVKETGIMMAISFDRETAYYDRIREIKNSDGILKFVQDFQNLYEEYGLNIHENDYFFEKLSILGRENEVILFIIAYPQNVAHRDVLSVMNRIINIPPAWSDITDEEVSDILSGEVEERPFETMDVPLDKEKTLNEFFQALNEIVKKDSQKNSGVSNGKEDPYFYKIPDIISLLNFRNVEGFVLEENVKEKPLYFVTTACMDEFFFEDKEAKALWNKNEEIFSVIIPSLLDLKSKMQSN